MSRPAPGTTIGVYRVEQLLGEGGMGAVYRATDTKLGREVAVKVLPDVFAQDADRLARFQREAELLASLNHPNIAGVFGLEQRALVLELVEGDTLADTAGALRSRYAGLLDRATFYLPFVPGERDEEWRAAVAEMSALD